MKTCHFPSKRTTVGSFCARLRSCSRLSGAMRGALYSHIAGTWNAAGPLARAPVSLSVRCPRSCRCAATAPLTHKESKATLTIVQFKGHFIAITPTDCQRHWRERRQALDAEPNDPVDERGREIGERKCLRSKSAIVLLAWTRAGNMIRRTLAVRNVIHTRGNWDGHPHSHSCLSLALICTGEICRKHLHNGASCV